MGPRLINNAPRERTKPMRVLVLGLSRTGTTSILVALRKLGYTPYSMRDLLTNPASIPLWREAITLTLLPTHKRPTRIRNRTIFPPFARQEFDTLLGEYDAVADLPAALFAKELVEAYPEAKVIVTTKAYEEWERSMSESVWLLLKWRVFQLTRWLGVTQMAPLTRLMHEMFGVFDGNSLGGRRTREAYEKYYADVRELVPEGKRLEVQSGKGDWDSLCVFLQVEKPEGVGAYPNMDEGTSMVKGLRAAWWEVVEWFGLIAGMVLVTVVGFVMIYWQAELWSRFEGALKVFEPWVGFLERNGTEGVGLGEKSEL
ncbi:uncharacterized protein EI97DRAFT_237001 [Westerdykella ornata]|uniref:NAD dependent epimerase/dehydratase n=1 Tax=Westerdykella ornata TaxID=318751 RepID=A0A6A6J8Q2_WESOR|nr:uncharacterized protein EI97DRAFT_237001 [Westerdykella ornata]KAF2272016.1 hypothetical protein EI97DRAFT_237001 [Westerdykella ornata]